MKKLICLLLASLMLLALWACSEEKTIPQDITFTGKTLMDNENFRFSVTKIQEINFEGCVMTVEMENPTDLHLMVSLDKASVDGCMCNPNFSELIEPKGILETQVVFPQTTLEAYGIDAVTEIDFVISIYDEDTYEEISIAEHYTLYPRGKDAARHMKRKTQDTDIVLMDNDQCSIIVTDKNEESFWGYDLQVYVKNKTDKALMFTTQEAFLNDVACDPFWTVTVEPGMCSNTTMYWFDNNLESAGITKVDTISLLLSVSYLEDWLNPLITEPVTFTP